MTLTLTREKILNMPAGREMDALIAERVMGYQYFYIDTYREFRYVDQEGNTYRPDGLPRFSEDISAAWQVVETIAEEKDVDLQTVVRGWRCIIRGKSRHDILVSTETAPLAICRAALLVLENNQ